MSAATNLGRITYAPQKGKPGSFYLAQLFDADGKSIAAIEATPDAADATEVARHLAARWNAFDGFEEVELLESVPGIGTAMLPYRILQARSNALLEATQKLLADFEGVYADAEPAVIGARAAMAAFIAPRTEL